MKHQLKYFINVLVVVPDGTEFGDSASVPVGEFAGEAAEFAGEDAVDKNICKLAVVYDLRMGGMLMIVNV